MACPLVESLGIGQSREAAPEALCLQSGGGQEAGTLAFTMFSTWAGTNEEILAHISEEGKKLMATADSVFTKVTDNLLSRTVLIEQLELIRSNMTQFLDIWDLSECGAEHGRQAARRRTTGSALSVFSRRVVSSPSQ